MRLRRRAVAATFAVVALWAGLGAGVQASYGARMIADEPQYVLSALSLAEDGDLDISDELAAERWRPFHRAELPQQTEPRANGSELSPHDPLLPLVLAPGVGLFGWVGARITMALIAGALAAVLAWTAVDRLGVARRDALVVVGAFSLSAPLAAYGSQVYPELPAALAVACAAAALLGPPSGRRTATWVAAVVALPWLGVKYAPVAAALAAVGLWLDLRTASATRSARETDAHLVGNGRRAGIAAAALVLAGMGYLWFHRAVYGGWTVYAAGDHFVDGELTVVGHDPDHVGRTIRLVGLLVDRHFGLVAWAPVYLVAVPALAALLARRRRHPHHHHHHPRSHHPRSGGPDRPQGVDPGYQKLVVGVPLAAGWATATWVALTMHGWWWPGRQTVVVLPLLVLAAAVFAAGRERRLLLVAAAGALGALSWAWLVVEATWGPITLVVDFHRTSDPWIRAWRWLLPDHRATGAAPVVSTVVWCAVLAGLAAAGWRSARADQDPFAGEGPDADGVAVDHDGRGAVRR